MAIIYEPDNEEDNIMNIDENEKQVAVNSTQGSDEVHVQMTEISLEDEKAKLSPLAVDIHEVAIQIENTKPDTSEVGSSNILT